MKGKTLNLITMKRYDIDIKEIKSYDQLNKVIERILTDNDTNFEINFYYGDEFILNLHEYDLLYWDDLLDIIWRKKQWKDGLHVEKKKRETLEKI